MIIDCISDLHGFYPELEGGDLLIVAGDWCANDTAEQFYKFLDWLERQNYNRKIIIAGNHDNIAIHKPTETTSPLRINYFIDQVKNAIYLCDSGTEVTFYPYLDPPNLDKIGVPYKRKTLKVYGSPWTKTFEGMNPHCQAFTVDEEELAEKWKLIPDDIDILITHSPAFEILDELCEEGKYGGSVALENVIKRIKPRLHIFGHIHESYGQGEIVLDYPNTIICVNASHVNEHYEPVNKPIRIIL
jgi:Icc-related predicted phosphoesterase